MLAWLAETIVRTLIDVYTSPIEGGDKQLQQSLKNGDLPHSRNLMGTKFQMTLHTSNAIFNKWLKLFGITNFGMSMEDLEKRIAPDTPFGFPKIPEGFL